MGKETDNNLLDEYLQGDSDLSKHYRNASTVQPSEQLDETILAASRKAVRSKPRLAYSPFSYNWGVPVSLAAVLVLSVGLVLTLHDETGQTILQDEQPVGFPDTPVYRSAQDEVKEMDDVIFEKPGRIMQDNKASKFNELRHEMKDVAPAMELNQEDSLPAAEPATGTYAPKPSDIKMKRRSVKNDAGYERQRIQVEEARTRVLKKEQTRSEVESEPSGKLLVPTETVEGAMEDKFRSDESYDAPASVVEPAKSVMQRKIITKSTDQLIERESEIFTPDTWLQHIYDLWQTNQHEEAKLQLNRFLERYPDYDADKLEAVLGYELVNSLLNKQ